MSVTSENYPPNDPDNTDFVLKHRIVGAAFLLFFSAMFLPWLLGPPGEVTTGENDTDAALQTPASLTETQKIEEDLLAAIEQNRVQEPVPEQVYISKITPLDGNRTVVAQAKPDTNAAANTSVKPSAADASVVTENPPAAPAATPDSPPGVTETVIANERPAIPVKTEINSADTTKIEVGWIVQVGVFTDKRGAAKVVEDLQQKGFDPVTTIVDTNRGAATGSRIWLGPFAQRVDAAKAKTQLKNKTGEAGFIRAYP